MAIRIERNEAGNCINFHGASNPVYFNACLEAAVDSSFPDTVNVLNKIKTEIADDPQYAFYRVPYTDFRRSDNTSFADAQEAADYITVNGNVSTGVTTETGYLGTLNASSSPDITTDVSTYLNGAWFFITEAGTLKLNGVDDTIVNVNDQIRFSSSLGEWTHIKDVTAQVEQLESSNVTAFDVHVDQSNTGSIRTGSVIYPFPTLEEAISATSPGKSVNIKGTYVVTDEINIPHSLYIQGSYDAEIKYATYNANNGSIFTHTGSPADVLVFKDITFRNAGGYGIESNVSDKFEVRHCRFYNCGWDGTTVQTALPAASTPGIFGYDSSLSDLQSFGSSASISEGGAVNISNSRRPLIRESRAEACRKGFTIVDSGIYGGGFIIENQAVGNVEEGFALEAGSLGGCQNMTLTVNYAAYNGSNGISVAGGLKNEISQVKSEANWSAGICLYGVSNFTLRDSASFNNVRSPYTALGAPGKGKGGVHIKDASEYDKIALVSNASAKYMTEILDTQVHYTGIGTAGNKSGIVFDPSLNDKPYDSSNIIKVDDVGFIGQDYAIDFDQVDLDNLIVVLGDNSYISINEKNVRPPANGSYSELPFSNHVTSVKELDIVLDNIGKKVTLVEGVGGNVINVYSTNELQAIDKGTHMDIIQKNSDKLQLRQCLFGTVYINGVLAGSNLSNMVNEINAAFELTLEEYKDFIETEVGVEGSDPIAWYFFKDASGKYHYPLFKTGDEANRVDAEFGAGGTSHTHTYPSDLSGTTWYMPDTNGSMDADAPPVNGLYKGIPGIIWNLHNTDDTDPTNPVGPVFSDAVYNALEGSYVNIEYKGSTDFDTYVITNKPSYLTDTGNALQGYAEDNITEGIQHVINVTRSNGNGTDSGTITLNVYNDISNDSSSETTFDSAISFTGSNKYGYENATGNNYAPLRMSGQAFNTSIDEGTSNISTHTAGTNNSRPWMVGIVFKHDGNASNQTIWGQCEGSGNSNDNIMVTIDANKNCYFQWGRESSGYNKKFLGNIPSHTWAGLSVVYKGQRWVANDATGVNLGDTFQFNWVDLATGDVSDLIYGNSNVLNNSTWSTTGKSTASQILGTFAVGGRLNNRSFKGDIASVVVSTLKIANPLPTDAEISMLIRDPKKWLTDYKVGQQYRSANSWSQSSTFNLNSNGPAWATKVWLMGDGTNDSYNIGIRNQVYPTDQNYTYLRFNNMASTDIVSASIAGITANANVVNYSGANFAFNSEYYNGYVINMTVAPNWSAALPDLGLVPLGYSVTFRNLASINNQGTFSAYDSQTIEGSAVDYEANGKVDVKFTKSSSTNWITEVVTYEEYFAESTVNGSTLTINDNYIAGNVNNVVDFSNVDTIVLNHNLGGVPVIQAWIEDGAGGYTDANIDIDHNWSTLNASTINLESVENGKLVYMYNS